MTLEPLAAYLAPIICEPDNQPRAKGRPAAGDAPMTGAARARKFRSKAAAEKRHAIAVIDFETDPFDNSKPDQSIFPFVACLHSDDFEPLVIWDDVPESFVARVTQAILDLPGKYTIFAHNGGKFDFMFLLHKLRGAVSFKGRGIMSAQIGNHTLRDSMHLIPEALASYKKDDFDYTKLLKSRRHKFRADIIAYLKSDCVYLLDIVSAFIREHGLKISIGQAAMAAVKKAGINVGKISGGTDAYLRNYFYGGRVECLSGPGAFLGEYRLYDVNSMYPFAMANFAHPIGSQYTVKRGRPGLHTVFLEIECENDGALIGRGPEGETTAQIPRGIFRTTIWEYEVAKKYGLIRNIKYRWTVNCEQRGDFSDFVIPTYEKRQLTKKKLRALKEAGLEETREFSDTKKDDMFLKFLLNNAYGKYAQNPRKYKDHYITDNDDCETRPPPTLPSDVLQALSEKEWRKRSIEEWGFFPKQTNGPLNYAIWEKPAPKHQFNNVGTAASITGAARAVLLEAICNSIDPIYCDTDSLICRELRNVEIHPEALGAWDIEDEFCDRHGPNGLEGSVIIAGKKLYGCHNKKGKFKIRAKGASGLEWSDLLKLVDNQSVLTRAKGITILKDGSQFYMRREVNATAKPANALLINRLAKRAHMGA